MDLSPTLRAREYVAKLEQFMDEHVYPAEAVYEQQRHYAATPHQLPTVVRDLQEAARERGLWNLFMTDERRGPGLTNLEYAPLAEVTGRSIVLAPEALNCAAPDTGNMEVLARYGTAAQQEAWLEPLLAGEIRSCFSMTEPAIASSDARNIETRITRDGNDYVVTGRKWWSTGALDSRCRVAIVMGVTDPDAPPYLRHSMVLVPLDTPGVTIERDLRVFGYTDQHGHGQILFDGVRVPAGNLIGQPGDGFAIAQGRLGPGRIHHCMRAIGLSERALEMLCTRVRGRVAFGEPLASKGVIQEWIALSRIEIEQATWTTRDRCRRPSRVSKTCGCWSPTDRGPRRTA